MQCRFHWIASPQNCGLTSNTTADQLGQNPDFGTQYSNTSRPPSLNSEGLQTMQHDPHSVLSLHYTTKWGDHSRPQTVFLVSVVSFEGWVDYLASERGFNDLLIQFPLYIHTYILIRRLCGFLPCHDERLPNVGMKADIPYNNSGGRVTVLWCGRVLQCAHVLGCGSYQGFV